MTIKSAADAVYAFRFLRKLTQRWEDMEAYELGIIDENGKVLKKARDLETAEEKGAYTYFHRLVFNIKRLLEKLPLGKTRLASFATALFLIKENTGMSDKEVTALLESFDLDKSVDLNEWYIKEGYELDSGTYTLTNTVYSILTAEPIANAGDKVVVENTDYIDIVAGTPIYKAKLKGAEVYVAATDIKK